MAAHKSAFGARIQRNAGEALGLEDANNPENLPALRAAFGLFDENNDGKINITELRELLAYVGRHPNEEQLEEIVDQIDVDGDSKLDFNEFRKVMDRFMAEETANEELKEAFRIFDKVVVSHVTDGNGFLTPKEMMMVMNKMGDPLTEEEATELVRSADIDGDGKLNFEEFYKVMTRLPDGTPVFT